MPGRKIGLSYKALVAAVAAFLCTDAFGVMSQQTDVYAIKEMTTTIGDVGSKFRVCSSPEKKSPCTLFGGMFCGNSRYQRHTTDAQGNSNLQRSSWTRTGLYIGASRQFDNGIGMTGFAGCGRTFSRHQETRPVDVADVSDDIKSPYCYCREYSGDGYVEGTELHSSNRKLAINVPSEICNQSRIDSFVSGVSFYFRTENGLSIKAGCNGGYSHNRYDGRSEIKAFRDVDKTVRGSPEVTLDKGEGIHVYYDNNSSDSPRWKGYYEDDRVVKITDVEHVGTYGGFLAAKYNLFESEHIKIAPKMKINWTRCQVRSNDVKVEQEREILNVEEGSIPKFSKETIPEHLIGHTDKYTQTFLDTWIGVKASVPVTIIRLKGKLYGECGWAYEKLYWGNKSRRLTIDQALSANIEDSGGTEVAGDTSSGKQSLLHNYYYKEQRIPQHKMTGRFGLHLAFGEHVYGKAEWRFGFAKHFHNMMGNFELGYRF